MNDQLYLLYDFACRLAEISYQNDDVPVGAVIYKDDTYEVVAPGFNQMKLNRSSLDHAEILALKLAMSRTGNERLNGCSMITTLEPCPMCAQAISFARLNSITFSAEDEKVVELSMDQRFLNHLHLIIKLVLIDSMTMIDLKNFFKNSFKIKGKISKFVLVKLVHCLF